jgi:hypothetical protein
MSEKSVESSHWQDGAEDKKRANRDRVREVRSFDRRA